MFIRKRLNKPFNHKPYFTYQVCKTYRVDRQVKQKVICSLGTCDRPESALIEFTADLEMYKHWLVDEEAERVYQSRQKSKEKRIAEYHKKIDFLEKKIEKIKYVVAQMTNTK